MCGNQVVYQVRRGADGLPCVISLQTQKCPETTASASGQLLSSTRGATPEEGTNVYFQYTRNAAIGKSENSCLAQLAPVRAAKPT